MYTLLLTLHVIVSISLIVVILIQSGRAGGAGGIFGGGSSDALFSAPSGSSFIKKLTAGLAIGFLCTTLFLTALGSRRTGQSVLQRVPIHGR